MALARWQSTFTDDLGNVIAGLDITVRDETSGAIAATFADRDGVTSKTTITTDANGFAFFYVASGRYRIQATDIDWRDVEITQQADIAQKADLAGGADANFTAMPQVGGDPVVESGSNSDGEWTRWADGTQICSERFGDGFKPPSSTYKRNTWVFPTAFLASPQVTGTANESSTEHNTDRFVNVNLGVASTSQTDIKAYTSGSLNLGFDIEILAIGRWK